MAIEAPVCMCWSAALTQAPDSNSLPIPEYIGDWLKHRRARASAKSPLQEALSYLAKCRDGFGRFLTDGRLMIDNNTVELWRSPWTPNDTSCAKLHGTRNRS